MSLNWKEIDAVLDELDVVGSRIQKVRQPNFHDLVLDLYAPGHRQTILISLEQARTRIHRITSTQENEVGLQRFAQLLRSRIVGGRITVATQIGEDRIVHLGIDHAGEVTNLYIRLWSGAANIIACDQEGTILDAFYRRPKRQEVSRAVFDPVAAIGGSGKKKTREFTIREFPDEPETSSLNARFEQHYSQEIAEADISVVRDRAERANAKATARVEAAIREINSRLEDASDYEAARRIGDLLSSNLHLVSPGRDSVTVPDYEHPGSEVQIELDPGMSPGENANRYYQKYKTDKSAIDTLREELSTLERELQSLEEAADTIERTDDLHLLESILGHGDKQTQTKASDDSRPGLQFESNGYQILVGRTATENDALLRRHVKGNDLWMHTRYVPGGYVFVRTTPGKSVPLEVLLDAGQLAVLYSKAKADGGADLYYTQVKYLRRAKHGKTGTVLPTQEKNLSIRLEDERVTRLFAPRSAENRS